MSNFKTFFDLLYMRSYKTAGVTGERYVFVKGKPVTVLDEGDAKKFRAQPEIFYEVDAEGNKVSYQETKPEARAFKRFRADNILPEDAEDLLKKVHEEAVANPQRVDVNALLEAANEDALKKDEVEQVEEPKETSLKNEASEEIIEKEEVKPEVKKKKKQKKNSCPKCSRSFNTAVELEKHLDDHDAEE